MMIQVEDRKPKEEQKADLAWFIVRSATRQEKRAEASLREAGFEVYMPRLKRLGAPWRGRKMVIEAPLFPGYMFVLLQDQSRFDLVVDAYGVHGFMKCGGRPAQIPVSDVLALQVAEQKGDFDSTKDEGRYRPGDAVRIRKGKFASWPAVILAMDGETRVRLLVTAFGRQHEKTVNLAAVVVDEGALRA